MHPDTAVSPALTVHTLPGPVHCVEPRAVPLILASSWVTNDKDTGVAVVRAHAEPNTVGIQAIAVTPYHQSALAHNHIPTLTTPRFVAGAVVTVGCGSRPFTITAAFCASSLPVARVIQINTIPLVLWR